MGQPRVHGSADQSFSTNATGSAARGPKHRTSWSRTVRLRASAVIAPSLRAAAPTENASRAPRAPSGEELSNTAATGPPVNSASPEYPSSRQNARS